MCLLNHNTKHLTFCKFFLKTHIILAKYQSQTHHKEDGGNVRVILEVYLMSLLCLSNNYSWNDTREICSITRSMTINKIKFEMNYY
jgi:hypothetical protein